jgi:hypothetical protein
VNWPCPDGGKIVGAVTFGFDNTFGFPLDNSTTGNQGWGIFDINGDDKPDMVVTGERFASSVKSYTNVNGQYWKVFLNNGNGFSTTHIEWPCPAGGRKQSGIDYGFYTSGYTALNSHNIGSQSWTIADMDGDKKLDLVITSELTSSGVLPYSASGNPYWKVYLNNGSGFNNTALNWPLPSGGLKSGTLTIGFNQFFGQTSSSTIGSQLWEVNDINGDGKPDIVVTSELFSNPNTHFQVFNFSTAPAWKVYLNNGNGFNTTETLWPIPNGGSILNPVNSSSPVRPTGFALFNDYSTNNVSPIGSQRWFSKDMNGDGKIDLIVTGEKTTTNSNSSIQSVFSYNHETSNHHWKVFLNNGAGFNTTPLTWSLPNAGSSEQSGYARTMLVESNVHNSSNSAGSISWFLKDLNADGNIDLVVPSQKTSLAYPPVFDASTSPYWKIYLGSGTGFATNPINWTLPIGGYFGNSINYGFHIESQVVNLSYDDGSQTYSLIDIDGNYTLDLLITAEKQGNVTSFSPTSNQYWKVFKNTTSTVNLKEIVKNNLHVIVSPNPSTGIFKIQATEKVKYKLFTVDGRLILTNTILEHSHIVDLSQLSDNIYFIEICDASNSTKVLKLVKSN